MAVVAVAGAYVVSQELESRRVAQAAGRLAAQAGCTDVLEQPDAGGGHLTAGQTTTYPRHPATSGIHDQSPLPPVPRVYDQPVPETKAVHNLEHGYVVMYYRQGGDDGLPRGVQTALSDLAEETSKVIMAPYPRLERGQALAFVAWDELQQCPSTVKSSLAVGLARSFIDRFRSGGRAPEAEVP